MKHKLFNGICHIDSFKGTKNKLPMELDGKVSKAFCVINYPFKKKKRIDFTFTSINDIVKAIKNGLIDMYCASKPTTYSTLINQCFDGEYGIANHPINDLVIESIEYDTDTSEMIVHIGS